MGLSLPQQQALYYYSHAWLTPGLPAVRRHRKSHFGAVFFFTTDLRPAVLSLSIKDGTLRDTEGKHACHYNDNISQMIALSDCLFKRSECQSFAAGGSCESYSSFLHRHIKLRQRHLFLVGWVTHLLRIVDFLSTQVLNICLLNTEYVDMVCLCMIKV